MAFRSEKILQMKFRQQGTLSAGYIPSPHPVIAHFLYRIVRFNPDSGGHNLCLYLVTRLRLTSPDLFRILSVLNEAIRNWIYSLKIASCGCIWLAFRRRLEMSDFTLHTWNGIRFTVWLLTWISAWSGVGSLNLVRNLARLPTLIHSSKMLFSVIIRRSFWTFVTTTL